MSTRKVYSHLLISLVGPTLGSINQKKLCKMNLPGPEMKFTRKLIPMTDSALTNLSTSRTTIRKTETPFKMQWRNFATSYKGRCIKKLTPSRPMWCRLLVRPVPIERLCKRGTMRRWRKLRMFVPNTSLSMRNIWCSSKIWWRVSRKDRKIGWIRLSNHRRLIRLNSIALIPGSGKGRCNGLKIISSRGTRSRSSFLLSSSIWVVARRPELRAPRDPPGVAGPQEVLRVRLGLE